MRNIKEIKKNINSVCNVVSLQSNHAERVRDIDLIIDLRSDVESCDNEIIESDVNKKCLPMEYDFEQDVEKLIEVSKQFQTDYENEKVSAVVPGVHDDCLNIPILNSDSLRQKKIEKTEFNLPTSDNDNFYFSNSSSKKENIFKLSSNRSNKKFTPKIPYPGPFGTGISRPPPKKHSCIQKSETTSTKRSCRAGWNVRPYTSRYYNFDRTHPDLELVENVDSIIPKRITKRPVGMADKPRSVDIKPLFNKGLTWHEFFERSNVYSAKSLQSSCGDVPTISEVLTPKSNEINKIQKHILPQLIIQPECIVQRIPEISIPCGPKLIVNSNIKLVEIIYEEAESKVQTIEVVKQSLDTLQMGKENTTDPLQIDSDFECTSSVDLESMPINDSVKFSELKTSLATSSKTLSEHNGYDSSLEDSVSLDVSRVSALTSTITDHEANRRQLKDVSVQTHKLKKTVKHRKEVEERTERNTIASSVDCSAFDNDVKHQLSQRQLQQQQHQQKVFDELELPTFPTNELIRMVDEIFDTSSEAVNVSYKHVVKETSVQTDIVWENINEMFQQQRVTIKEFEPAISGPRTNKVVDIFAKPDTIFAGTQISNVAGESSKIADRACRHTQLKKFKICTCLACKTNIRFSVSERKSSSDCSSSSSLSGAYNSSRPSMPAARNKLLPSERYKQMKQAQRKHFETDPRISRTLRKIYATAKTMESRKETSSSSSNLSDCEDEALQPDLYTFSDEALLFGFHSSNDNPQYPSYLLKTESSETDTTSGSNDIKSFKVMDTSSRVTFTQTNLFCTNSEDSCSNNNLVYSQRGSQLERCLLKDIENSGSDPSDVLVSSSVFSTSSLERKIYEFQLDGAK